MRLIRQDMVGRREEVANYATEKEQEEDKAIVNIGGLVPFVCIHAPPGSQYYHPKCCKEMSVNVASFVMDKSHAVQTLPV